MDKRHYERVETRVEARVTHDGRCISGKMTNLSINGMFFETIEKIPLRTIVDLEIALPQSAPKALFKLRGRVVRVEDSGIAIHFAMDLEAYKLLKGMVSKIRD